MIARSASAPVGAGSRRSPSRIAPSRSVSRTRTARFSRSNSVSLRRLDALAERCADIVLRNRGGRNDARVLRLALQIGDDEEFLAGQRIGGIEHRAAPVRQDKAPALAARHGDAIGPGMDQQRAGCTATRMRRCGFAAGLARQPLGQLARGRGARRSFRRKSRQPPFEIGAVAAEPAFGDSTASMAASNASPDFAASLTICASRTGSASRRIARPLRGDPSRRRRSRQASSTARALR